MDSPGAQTAGRIAELVNRLGRTVHCLQFSHGLNPAQWETLRYMCRANRYSRTPSALAAFLGTTKGTASQTIKALESKGYLARRSEPSDRRICRIEVTPSGRHLLENDPIHEIERAVAGSGLDLGSTLLGLDCLLQGLHSSCGRRAFGTCERCHHLSVKDEGTPTEGAQCCGLTGDCLDESDKKHICVNFAAARS